MIRQALRLTGALLAAVVLIATTPAEAQPVEDPYRLVMALGDSITAGHGDPAWNGYRGDLYGRLRDNGYRIDNVGSCSHPTAAWKCPYKPTHWDWQHEGHSGWRIDQIRAHMDLLMERYRPETVLLHLGTNDIGQGYDLPNAPARLRDLVERIRELRPEAHIFVAGIIRSPLLPQDAVTAYVNATASMVNQMRAGGDLRVHFVPQQIIGQTAGDVTADAVHPSPCGYAKMAYVWWLYIRNSPVGGGAWPQTRPNPWYDTSGPCAAQIAQRR